MRHNILRIADARGHMYLENEYAGPEAGWAFNTVARQLAGGFEYRFDLEQIQFVAPDAANLGALATRTYVAPPDGSLHVYTFNYRGDLLDHRFRLKRDGSNRVITEQFSYDAAGNRTEAVGPDGLRQITTYDAANPDRAHAGTSCASSWPQHCPASRPAELCCKHNTTLATSSRYDSSTKPASRHASYTTSTPACPRRPAA